MIPEEDRGPVWLSDYGYTDFSQIEADIQAMETFAAQLAANVKSSYAPHLTGVTDAMMTELPAPPASFAELFTFLSAHNAAQNITQQNVYNYANGTQDFASVAADISKRYRGSDAFAHARVTDVERAFNKVGMPDATDGEGDL